MATVEEAARLGLRRESAEVYYATDPVARADDAIVDFLKREASRAARLRCRLCLHHSPEARQQEMLIVMHRDSFVAPHKHVGKDETLLVLEGTAAAPVFDDDGNVAEAIELGQQGSGRCFFYHMPEGVYHGLSIESEWLVYVETTLGPFRRAATVFPAWAPAEADIAGVDDFQARIQRAIRVARAGLPSR
jgi:cupin fold WbuC family metalloprotein